MRKIVFEMSDLVSLNSLLFSVVVSQWLMFVIVSHLGISLSGIDYNNAGCAKKTIVYSQ